MPCADWTDTSSYEKEYRNEQFENTQLRERNNKLAQMLCGLCNILENEEEDSDLLINRVPDLTAWWTKHKEDDAARLREEKRIEEARKAAEKEKNKIERLKRQALSKLTDEELKALGVK